MSLRRPIQGRRNWKQNSCNLQLTPLYPCQIGSYDVTWYEFAYKLRNLNSSANDFQTEEICPVWNWYIDLRSLSTCPEHDVGWWGGGSLFFCPLCVCAAASRSGSVLARVSEQLFSTVICHLQKDFLMKEVGMPAGHNWKERLSHVICPQTVNRQAGISLLTLCM
jgi:hypothetical protein